MKKKIFERLLSKIENNETDSLELTHYSLRSGRTHSNLKTKELLALAEALKYNHSVTHVGLVGYIRNKMAIALAEALKLNGSIVSIKLEGNYIRDEGAIALAEALKINNSVISLNLSKNNIGYKGVVVLAEALKVNNSITSLNLSKNNIGDKGIMALAEAFKINSTLTMFAISNNYLGDKGAIVLAGALNGNNSIRYIDLSENAIGDEGAIAFANTLRINKSIIELYLYNNAIGERGAVEIIKALKINDSITGINIIDEEIEDLLHEYYYDRYREKNRKLSPPMEVIEFIKTYEASIVVGSVMLKNIHLMFKYARHVLEERLMELCNMEVMDEALVVGTELELDIEEDVIFEEWQFNRELSSDDFYSEEEIKELLYNQVCNMKVEINFFKANLICNDVSKSGGMFARLPTDIIKKILIDHFWNKPYEDIEYRDYDNWFKTDDGEYHNDW